MDYNKMHAPLCPYCKDAFVRPDVVWYGETLPPSALRRAFEVAIKCDAMLVVGTSGIVQPAAALPLEARRAGAIVIEANTEPSQIMPVADVFLQGASGQMLPQLINALKKGKIDTNEP